MFERLARQEEQQASQEQRPDVFKEATEQEKQLQAETNSLPVNDQVTSSTEVNGQGNADVEMQEDDKGGVTCWHPADHFKV